MLPIPQVDRVLAASETGGLQVVGLGEAMGFAESAPLPGDRVLVCRGSSGTGRVGLRVVGTLEEHELEGDALVALPRMLRRLSPPVWLAGLARNRNALALVVDLSRLTDELLRTRPEPPDAARRTD